MSVFYTGIDICWPRSTNLNEKRSPTRLAVILLVGLLVLPSSRALGGAHSVTYHALPLAGATKSELMHYYTWRNKMDWLVAPIHSRADLERYLKNTAKSGSPLDALSPDARKRFLSSIVFGPHGAGSFNYLELQYLSTPQIYKILSLFGLERYTLQVSDGRIYTEKNHPSSNLSRPPLLEKKFDKYWKVVQATFGESWRARSTTIENSYNHLFADHQNKSFVKSASISDLTLLFRAAYLAAFYTYRPKYSADAWKDFSEMEIRHSASRPYDHQMYMSLIDTQQFNKARAFSHLHAKAGLTPFPAYRGPSSRANANLPAVLKISLDKRELIFHHVSLNRRAQVLILTDPNCHFCTEFAEDLQSHSTLRRVLERHALWVTPPSTELDFDKLQRWDKDHPTEAVSIMFSPQGWPMKNFVIGTPRFFFIKDGEVVAKHIGWSGAKDFPAVEAGLKAIGLLN